MKTNFSGVWLSSFIPKLMKERDRLLIGFSVAEFYKDRVMYGLGIKASTE